VIDVHSLALDHTDDGTREYDLDTRIDYASNNNQGGIAVRGGSSGERWSFAGGVVVRDGDNIEAPDSATAFESGDASVPAFTANCRSRIFAS
jgi:hypothetical protein